MTVTYLTPEQKAEHIDLDTLLPESKLKDMLASIRAKESKQQRAARLRNEHKEHVQLIRAAGKVLSTKESMRVDAKDFPIWLNAKYEKNDCFGSGLSFEELGKRLGLPAGNLFRMKDQLSIHRAWLAAVDAHRDLKLVLQTNHRQQLEIESLNHRIMKLNVDLEASVPITKIIQSRAVDDVIVNGVSAAVGILIAVSMTRGVGLASIEGVCISDVGKYLDALDPAESEKLVDDWYFSSMSRLSREISSLNSSGIDVKEVSVMLAALKTEQEIVKDLSSKFGDRANQRKKASTSKSISITKVYSDAK